MAFLFRPTFLAKLKVTCKFFPVLKKLNLHSLRPCYDFSTGQAVAPQPLNLDDKVALVTGGGSGIGLCVAKELLRNGISGVTIVDIDAEKAKENVKELTSEYGEEKVLFVEADVGDSKQFDQAFKTTVSHFDSVNIVVNNAGIMNDTTWERQIKTNLSGNVIGTLLGMQHMSKTASGEGGIIVNMGSIMSVIPSSGCPLHTMTQFGIVGFTKALGSSNHFERTAVKILAMCPGLTSTQLLKDAPRHAINENFANEFMEETDGCDPQNPESVAKGLVCILDEAKPGSVWVVENNGSPYEVNFPEAASLKQKKAQA